MSESRRLGGQPPLTAALIRDLLDSGRIPTEAEIDHILTAMRKAPHATHDVAVRPAYRGVVDGTIIEAHAPSDLAHLARRIGDGQWSRSTTLAEYLADAHAAIDAPGGRLVIYSGWQGELAAVLAPRASVVPTERLGHDPLPWMFIVFRARSQEILTAYMVSGPSSITIGGDARWLT